MSVLSPKPALDSTVARSTKDGPDLAVPVSLADRRPKPKKTVVISRTGPIGSRVVTKLHAASDLDVVLAAPRTGCDAVTNEGVADAVAGADVLVDLSNAPWSDDVDVVDFFTTSTTNLITAAKNAGVGHYVVLSVAGGDRQSGSDFLRAKAIQERLVAGSGIPYSIVRATQFLDYAKVVAELATADGEVRVPPVYLQPLGSHDVAAAVVRHATGEPVNGVVETGWPETAWTSSSTTA